MSQEKLDTIEATEAVSSEDTAKAAKNSKKAAEEIQPLDIHDVEKAIEAILFAAGYPVTYEKLSLVIGLTQRDVRRFVEHMADGYGDRGIQLLMYPDACQLSTKEVFAPYIREALGIRRGGNLSASSMEVLAVVAYNQPVTRAFVDTVRGVDSSYAVSSLLDKGLIEACGRLDAPGRPMLYATTDKFLRVFGLSSLADLPETEALGVAEATLNQNRAIPLTIDDVDAEVDADTSAE
ncbi:MAG: SMC-Scp complex subunit ScpB [Ruminococcaceae bacterium]|nr:SMC-Scp complex subunit ScpB [Oscillospiraceae bacterium]